MVVAETVMEAAYRGDFIVVRLALENRVGIQDPNDTNAAGDTLLFPAVLGGHVGMTKFLLARGADPNWPGGALPPIYAAGTGEMVDLLVSAGANIDAVGPSQSTPLIVAAQRGLFDLTRALLARGADISARNDQGLDAGSVARTLKRVLELMQGNVSDLLADNAHAAYVMLLVALMEDGGPGFRPQYARIDALISDVQAAGSWRRYEREPFVKLHVLRRLCLQGRGVAPANFVRLFGAPPSSGGLASRTRSRRASPSTLLPDECFAHVLGFWDGPR